MSREFLLSSHIQEGIRRYHLGTPLSVHCSKQAHLAVRISLLQGISMLIAGAGILWIREQTAVISEISISISWLPGLIVAILICSIVVVGLSSFTFIKSIFHLKDGVVVCTGGLLCIYGKKNEPIHWDDIVEVWEAIQYTIVRADRTKYIFPILTQHFRDVSPLRVAIAREVIARLLPQAIRQLDEGKTINFGKYSLSKQTLNDPWKSLPWEEITAFEAREGHFFYRRVGIQRGAHFADTSALPNSFLFLALVQHILEAK